MKIVFADQAWEDLTHWIEKDRRMALRIIKLIDAIRSDPFGGIGKPEPLRHELAGYWSRRIDGEHRLIYKVERDSLLIAQARYHY